MDETTTFTNYSDNSKPPYDQYLPGAVQVLVKWLLLIVTTIIGFFQNREQ